ncbi:hypothetical protein [Arsukibacterium perlucidum]|uniref:hypothetical protein n=1 Tax=Arsukibacterium perlucidum TaxID=368811 RepID=UPI000685FA47|nr:hypothetical protein [Arsukibacterium perlucidum]
MQNVQIDRVTGKNWLNTSETKQITALIASSFKGVDAEWYFNHYFESNHYYQRCVRLFYQNGQLVGYCLLTFSKDVHNSIVMGASAAFLSRYRGNNNTFAFSFVWAVKTWLCHLNRKVYYLDTMLSPAMYRAIGKRLAFIYPNPDMSQQDKLLYQSLVSDTEPSAEPSPWQQLRCLKIVSRATNYSDDEISRLKASEKAEIAFYCRVNPSFAQGSALLVLIPVNIRQITLTCWKWLKGLLK